MRSINGLSKYKLGAQLGTTSYQYITATSSRSRSVAVYDTNDAAVAALKNGQIDGLVVDLPTAFYVTAVQVPNGKLIGQFPAKGTQERFGMVFQKGNSLVDLRQRRAREHEAHRRAQAHPADLARQGHRRACSQRS